jgi:hypothetical protein
MLRRALVLLLLLSSAAATADTIEEIAGSSPKEMELRWLWKYTGDFVSACAVSGPECQDPAIKPVIDQLVAQFPAQPESVTSAWGRRLKFESEAKNPGLFETGVAEPHRLAVTALQAGADVTVNTDRMEQVENAQWIGHFVHETVHHLGIPDDERRLPDIVGAAVATFASRSFSQTDLSEYGHAEDHVLVFSSPAQDRPARMLINIRDRALDTNLTANERVPICASGETFVGQKMEPLFWRTTYIRGDQGYLYARGSSRVFNICRGADGGARGVETAFILNAELRFWERFDNRAAYWKMRSEWALESLAGGNYDGADIDMETKRTFAVESMSQSASQVTAGSELKTTAIVVSTDGMVPQTCGGAVAGSRWFFHRVANLSMFDWYKTCSITPLGENRYQIDASMTIPENAQPDVFRLLFFYFEGAGTARYAFPAGKLQFIEVVNPNASPRMKATNWETKGLESFPSMYGTPIKNSFKIEHDKLFFVDIGLSGKQELFDVYLDVALIVQYNGELLQLPWNVEIKDAPEFVKSVEYLPSPTGKRARLHFTLPHVLQNMPVVGFKLVRVSFKTDDYSWVEANMPNFLEGFFLTDEVPR